MCSRSASSKVVRGSILRVLLASLILRVTSTGKLGSEAIEEAAFGSPAAFATRGSAAAAAAPPMNARRLNPDAGLPSFIPSMTASAVLSDEARLQRPVIIEQLGALGRSYRTKPQFVLLMRRSANDQAFAS
jgi:hypothetical protein